MLKRFLIGFIILCLGFSVFPNNQEVDASTTKQQLLIINKKINKLAFYENGKLIKTYSVATGRTSKLTPEGTFYIREKIVNRPWYKGHIPGGDPRNPLGKRWLGLSKKENGGYPYGIHGNSNESSIGKYVSGGCVRMHNNEVIELFSKVGLGAKVVITSSTNSFNLLASPFFKNIDIKAPSVPAVNTISDNSIDVSGKTEKGATVTVAIGSKKYTAKPADSQGKFKVTIPKQKAGTKLSITAKDIAGNISVPKSVIVVDKTAPSTPVVSPVSDQSEEITGKTEAGAMVTVVIDTKKFTSQKADAKGAFKVTIPKQKAGTKISVTAADAAKNESPATKISVLDKTAPSAPKVETAVINETIEITVTTEAFGVVTVKIGEDEVVTGKANEEGSYKVVIPVKTVPFILSVTVTDEAKNISNATNVEIK